MISGAIVKGVRTSASKVLGQSESLTLLSADDPSFVVENYPKSLGSHGPTRYLTLRRYLPNRRRASTRYIISSHRHISMPLRFRYQHHIKLGIDQSDSPKYDRNSRSCELILKVEPLITANRYQAHP